MSTILIIDDDPKNIDLMKSYLHLYHIDTLEAYTGKEGVELAKVHQPDLIFTDLRMPLESWDGYETIVRLKTNIKTRHIPIVVITAAGDLPKAKQAGCDDILMRPFRTNQLKNILKHYLGYIQA